MEDFMLEEFKRTKKKKIHTGCTGAGTVSCYIGGDRWLFLHRNGLMAGKILNKAIDDLILKHPELNKYEKEEEKEDFEQF
jgi:hypothetical protein